LTLPLEGLLVVALEQAVAAPMCTCRLADAGARVIKVEKTDGDFARGYDDAAKGQSSYFVWLNRGKESIVLDLKSGADKAFLETMLGRADVLVQNLKPGVLGELGFSRERLRRAFPRLVIASISGYGESGPYAKRKAYDLLIQAEAGLASLTGGPDGPTRVGVSVVDIATGMNAYEAVLEALLVRARTGDGADLRISMFDSIADWSAVPLLQYEGGQPPRRLGLAHPSIAPYGVFSAADGTELLISTQSDREWRILAGEIMGDPALAAEPRFATNVARVRRREEVDGLVQAALGRLAADELVARLMKHEIAFGRVNDMAGLAAHPHLRRITVETPAGPVSMPAPPLRRVGEERRYGPVPGTGQHTAALRKEFSRSMQEADGR
jgi:itaconate CoA-transferase